jgi:hypothetical protein
MTSCATENTPNHIRKLMDQINKYAEMLGHYTQTLQYMRSCALLCSNNPKNNFGKLVDVIGPGSDPLSSHQTAAHASSHRLRPAGNAVEQEC